MTERVETFHGSFTRVNGAKNPTNVPDMTRQYNEWVEKNRGKIRIIDRCFTANNNGCAIAVFYESLDLDEDDTTSF